MNWLDMLTQAVVTAALSYGACRTELVIHRQQIRDILSKIQECPQKCAAIARLK